jgi:hypothetical protein
LDRGEPLMKRRLSVAAVIVALMCGFVFALYQPWSAQWGSTAAERAARMPGDSLVVDGHKWTRSITVNAPPDRVWPWLVQIGVDKGGFYTFDWAERLAGDPVHNTNRVHPEWQTLRPGQPVRPAPNGDPWIAETVTPPTVLVLSGDKGNWSWTTQLRRMPGDRTRVVTRMTSTGDGALGPFLDPADLIVFPRLLVGLKQRAEGTLPGMPRTHVGAPLPISRLPVAWWAALAWVAGLAGLATLGRTVFAFGSFGLPRPHPGILAGIAFVAGAGYLIMSDSPPQQFLSRSWPIGLGLAIVLGAGLGRMLRPAHPVGRHHRVGRCVQAVSEAGLLIVLPVAAIWHGATRLGWTEPPVGHAAIVAVAMIAVATVTGIAWWRTHRSRGIFAAVLLAGCFAVTGSGLTVLAGAVAMELAAGYRRHEASAQPPNMDRGETWLAPPSMLTQPVHGAGNRPVTPSAEKSLFGVTRSARSPR